MLFNYVPSVAAYNPVSRIELPTIAVLLKSDILYKHLNLIVNSHKFMEDLRY